MSNFNVEQYEIFNCKSIEVYSREEDHRLLELGIIKHFKSKFAREYPYFIENKASRCKIYGRSAKDIIDHAEKFIQKLDKVYDFPIEFNKMSEQRAAKDSGQINTARWLNGDSKYPIYALSYYEMHIPAKNDTKINQNHKISWKEHAAEIRQNTKEVTPTKFFEIELLDFLDWDEHQIQFDNYAQMQMAEKIGLLHNIAEHQYCEFPIFFDGEITKYATNTRMHFIDLIRTKINNYVEVGDVFLSEHKNKSNCKVCELPNNNDILVKIINKENISLEQFLYNYKVISILQPNVSEIEQTQQNIANELGVSKNILLGTQKIDEHDDIIDAIVPKVTFDFTDHQSAANKKILDQWIKYFNSRDLESQDCIIKTKSPFKWFTSDKNKGNNMQTQTQETTIELKVNGKSIEIKDDKKCAKLKTEFEKRPRYLSVWYDPSGMEIKTFRHQKKSEVFKILKRPENIGNTVSIYKIGKSLTTDMPVTEVE